MVLYEQLKEGVKKKLGRELKVYETISVGALSGALAAAATTPADVLKTRMMTGTVKSLSMSASALEIIQKVQFDIARERYLHVFRCESYRTVPSQVNLSLLPLTQMIMIM